MADNPRIEELRRRVQKDPASIAFAQLAEEYRRGGNYDEAISICRAGLESHPSYLSARVTLGRALIEMNDLEAAEAELTYVLQHAAENLAAIRGLAEIHHRRGNLDEALTFYKSALTLARHDPDLEQTVDEISRTIAPARAPTTTFEVAPSPTPIFDAASIFDALPEFQQPAPVQEAAPIYEPAPVHEPVPVYEPAPADGPAPFQEAAPVEEAPAFREAEVFDQTPVFDQAPVFDEVADFDAPAAPDPALPGLERFLEAIHTYRQRRAS